MLLPRSHFCNDSFFVAKTSQEIKILGGVLVGFELKLSFIMCIALYHHTRTIFAVYFPTILCLLFLHNHSMRMHIQLCNDIYICKSSSLVAIKFLYCNQYLQYYHTNRFCKMVNLMHTNFLQ